MTEQELVRERAAWKKATECETPEDAKHATELRYEWLHGWQEWARKLLERLGLQLPGGHYGDQEARRILGEQLERMALARELVDVQAEDDGLWFMARYITEGALQQALRELHELVEGKTQLESARDLVDRARERQP
jgi:hypothetical protein